MKNNISTTTASFFNTGWETPLLPSIRHQTYHGNNDEQVYYINILGLITKVSRIIKFFNRLFQSLVFKKQINDLRQMTTENLLRRF